MILNNSFSVSSITSQNTLNKLGIRVKKAQYVLAKKKDTHPIDYKSLSAVRIDDFAIKKCHTYRIEENKNRKLNLINDVRLFFKN